MYFFVKDTAAVNAYMNMDEVKDILPRDVRFAWTVKPYDPEGKLVQPSSKSDYKRW